MNILIVDDQPTNLKLLRAQLETQGHEVIAVANGIEALAVLERRKVDAIISDILMPEMDGYRLCYEVRKNARTQATPFIFHTATYTSPGDEKLCFELGGDKYLRKPASLEDLLAALRQATEITGRPPSPVGPLSDADVMKEYNQSLVSKLEAKHSALEELNRTLESRVQERTTELEALNKELEAFSYSISHELRSPLRAISSRVRICQEEHASLPDGVSRTLDRIYDDTVHMSELIDGLLALARLSRQPLVRRTVSAVAIAKEVLEQLQVGQEGRNVKVSLVTLPDCESDPTLLRQVFVNLLSNALKYSRQRDPAVIEVGYRFEQDQPVYFVRDNGAGFDMQYAGKLFEVFERLHGRKEFEGIGIGLSIVQRIIQRHGGRIWAEAAVDQGATFYFTLPS